MRESHERAGHITHDEANEIFLRFVNGWFRNQEREHPRISIPANPKRDDDIRLGAYIEQQRRLAETMTSVEETGWRAIVDGQEVRDIARRAIEFVIELYSGIEKRAKADQQRAEERARAAEAERDLALADIEALKKKIVDDAGQLATKDAALQLAVDALTLADPWASTLAAKAFQACRAALEAK